MDILSRTAILAANEALRTRLDPIRPGVSGQRLSGDHSRLLDSIIRADPDAQPAAIAQRFTNLAGRSVVRTTIVKRRRRRLEALAAVAAWPAWTDELSLDLPWSEGDSFNLGPNARPIGGAR